MESSDEDSDEPEKVAKLNEELTKISTQNEVNGTTTEENDEEKEDTTNGWDDQINKIVSEYKTLMTKWRDHMKERCPQLAKRYEEEEELIQKFFDNWSFDKSEKLLEYVDWQLKKLKCFLASSYFP